MLIIIVALGGHFHRVVVLEAAPAQVVIMNHWLLLHVHRLGLRGQILKQEVLHGLAHVVRRLLQIWFKGRIGEHVFRREVIYEVLAHASVESNLVVR